MKSSSSNLHEAVILISINYQWVDKIISFLSWPLFKFKAGRLRTQHALSPFQKWQDTRTTDRIHRKQNPLLEFEQCTDHPWEENSLNPEGPLPHPPHSTLIPHCPQLKCANLAQLLRGPSHREGMGDVKMLKVGKFLTKSFTNLRQLLEFYKSVGMKLFLFLNRCLWTASSLWFVYGAKWFELQNSSC